MINKTKNTSFWVKLVKITLILLAVSALLGAVFGSGMFTLAYFQNKNVPYTSDQLLTSVNEYRTSKGLKPLLLSAPLCNDLVSRWDNYVKNQNHEGLQEWVTRTGVSKQFRDGHENIVNEPTLEKAMDWWLNSQGHRLALEDPQDDSACVFVRDNIAVLMMADDITR